MIRPRRRAASPVLAQVFLLAMTITIGATLWSFRPPLPPQPSTLTYEAVGGQSEPTWGDGSDCKNVNGVQSCLVLPVTEIVLTGSSPSSVWVSSLSFYLLCNGTVYLGAPLSAIEWVPGSTGTPGGNAPQLGTCGTYVPPAAAFNRLTFFDQLVPGDAVITPGDAIVLYHPFEPPNCPTPHYDHNGNLISCDDDFHGVPGWCYTIPGACTVLITYAGPPSATVVSIPLYSFSP